MLTSLVGIKSVNCFMFWPLVLSVGCFMLVCLSKFVNVNVVCMFSSPSLIPWALLCLTHCDKDALHSISFPMDNKQ